MTYIYVLYDTKEDMYYVGKHKYNVNKVKNPYNDGYPGSGVIVSNIRKAIGDKEFWKRFEKYIVEFIPGEFAATDDYVDVYNAERSWIAYYRELYGSKKLYNKADGGDGGDTFHTLSVSRQEEIVSKIKKANTGRRHSDIHNSRISEANKGKIFTKEHRKHLSEALRNSPNNRGEKNHFYGKPLPKEQNERRLKTLMKTYEEHPEILQESRINGSKAALKTSKCIIGMNKETLEWVEFDSVSNAARWLAGEIDNTRKISNLNSAIIGCLKEDKYDRSLLGYKWRYATEDEVREMKRTNIYSADIYQYSLDHGTDIFVEYKLESTTEERRQEIEDWLFNLMREKNVVPIQILDENAEIQDLISLSERSPEDSYDFEAGDYKTNSVCVTFLNRFFAKELCDIRKPNAPRTIEEGFHDDKVLKRVIKKALKYTNDETGIFRWLILAGSCGNCSNYRPASAKALYEIFGKKESCRVIDSSAGYGARMLGAHFASNVVEYLGIDPNTAVPAQEEIKFLDEKFPTGTKKQVLKMGSEDFTPENFPQYQNYFDLYFSSPPYWNTEEYSDDPSQSYKKFPSYALWCSGFLQATIDNMCSALKIDGIFAINIFEKVPNIKKIIKLFLANSGFYVYRNDKYLLKTMPGGKKNKDGTVEVRSRDKYSNFEPVWYAKHYTQLLKEGLITKEQALQFRERAIKDTHKDEASIILKDLGC